MRMGVSLMIAHGNVRKFVGEGRKGVPPWAYAKIETPEATRGSPAEQGFRPTI